MNTAPIPHDTHAFANLPVLAARQDFLAAREADLLARLAEAERATLAHAEEASARETVDFKDEAERAEAGLVADAQAARLHADLAEVRAAMARLHAGAHGVCADCGDPISPSRLQFVPWAIRCTACQATHERLGQAHTPRSDQALRST